VISLLASGDNLCLPPVVWRPDMHFTATGDRLRKCTVPHAASHALGRTIRTCESRGLARDSARNDKSGPENLDDLTALVHRPAEKDNDAAIKSRARRRDLDDLALNM
jgi:hypothetical protein